MVKVGGLDFVRFATKDSHSNWEWDQDGGEDMEGHLLWSVARDLESFFRAVVEPVVGFTSCGLRVCCTGDWCRSWVVPACYAARGASWSGTVGRRT